jgi:hypothetical protein
MGNTLATHRLALALDAGSPTASAASLAAMRPELLRARSSRLKGSVFHAAAAMQGGDGEQLLRELIRIVASRCAKLPLQLPMACLPPEQDYCHNQQ